jgi:hypothetical protein
MLGLSSTTASTGQSEGRHRTCPLGRRANDGCDRADGPGRTLQIRRIRKLAAARAQPDPDDRNVASRVAGGIAAPGSLGSRRDSLPSPGSSDQP